MDEEIETIDLIQNNEPCRSLGRCGHVQMKDIFSISYYLATISWSSSYLPSPRRSHIDGPQGRLDSVIDPYIYILDRVEVAHSMFAHLRFFQDHSLHNRNLALYMIDFIMCVWAYEACFKRLS